MEVNVAEDFSKAQHYFKNQQLNFPFIPKEQQEKIKRLEMGLYGTQDVECSLYDLPYFLKKALSDAVNHFVLLGFAGHGISSRAMHYYLSCDHLVLLFQKGYGNAQRDSNDERAKVNALFDSAKLFFDQVHHAVKSNTISDEQRLCVVVSDMHPSGWGWINGKSEKINDQDWHQSSDFLEALESIPLR